MLFYVKHVVLCDAMLCYGGLYYIMLCYAILFGLVLCYAILCYVILGHTM